MTFPFGEQAPSLDSRHMRLAAIHLATHALDGPTAMPEPEATESGLLVAKVDTAEEKIGSVIKGAGQIMQFIDQQGSVSAHTVALEEIRDMLTFTVFTSDHLARLRAIVSAALGAGR